ncbi:MAG TPA: LuxR C-terminal-related transcriptional regulator [Ramlibacter sp.]|nr:LuxR C-terminal-related transcriptional regulator [Ramlibacter sp.]
MDAALQHGTGFSARGAFDGPAAGLSLVMDELAYGVLLATLQGQLLHANLAARHELARRKVLTVHEGHVQTVDAAQARALLNALARAETGRRSLISLRASGTLLSVAVVPLRARREETGSVALVFSRVSVCDAVMLCFFARTYGLTPSEEQVLAILCRGYSAPEVAQQLNVAVSTVRSHVRSLCAKTHSNGVRALVGQIAVLPPIGAAHPQDPLH